MKFKIDENLPVELANLLQEAGHDAVTVNQQKLSGEKDPRLFDICQQEGRILVTLDLDFADIRKLSPKTVFWDYGFPGYSSRQTLFNFGSPKGNSFIISRICSSSVMDY